MIALTSAAAVPPPPPTTRISAAGIYYGACNGITFAVVLYPELCGWERGRPRPVLAIR
jgi:hypothetical protein